jgi:hypothetical protein
MATGPQLTKLAILRAKSKRTREEWFDWITTEIGRPVKSNTELSVREASHLIETSEVTETTK